MGSPEDLANQLITAVRAGDVTGVERALTAGADANARHEVLGDSTPALVLAAEVGEWNLVRLLVNAGADVEARSWRERPEMFGDGTYNEMMWNAMETAIRGDHLDIVEHLLTHGANPDAALKSSMSKPKIARFLLDRGVTPANALVSSCVTNGALSSGNLAGLKLLLEYGADPNAITWGGKPPIVLAIHYGRLEEARALLAAGARRPTQDDVDKALADARISTDPKFTARTISTARALGFIVKDPT